jgi:glutaminase
MNYASVLEQIHHDLRPYLGTGKVADYIPQMAQVPADSFGMAIVKASGEVFRTGQADTRFSIQSISKLFACTMAFRLLGDAQSELHAHRNRAMAHFMASFGNMEMPAEDVVDAYCRHCAISMSCVELAKAALFLTNHGVVPSSGERILDTSSAKRLSALMLTCGTYDAAGDFVYRVRLPAKSGVGGGIVAVLPGEIAVCVWSPGLDANGNSLAGVLALEWLTTYTGPSIF